METEATSDLGRDARESIGFIPCPSCKGRGLGLVLRFALRASMLTILVGFVVGLFTTLGLGALDIVNLSDGFSQSIKPGRLLRFALPLGFIIFAALEIALIAVRASRARRCVVLVPAKGT